MADMEIFYDDLMIIDLYYHVEFLFEFSNKSVNKRNLLKTITICMKRKCNDEVSIKSQGNKHRA